jgi:Family of unknown function (DUF6130)
MESDHAVACDRYNVPFERTAIHFILKELIAMAACTVLTATAVEAQSARDIRGPSPLIAIKNEPPPKLIVDSPLDEPLSRGLVFIQYRAENLRVVPVFGAGALDVSPRIGHVHITVDDAPWHFVDASGETIIVVGLKPGPHQVLVELADPTHHVVDSKTVSFDVPLRPNAR